MRKKISLVKLVVIVSIIILMGAIAFVIYEMHNHIKQSKKRNDLKNGIQEVTEYIELPGGYSYVCSKPIKVRQTSDNYGFSGEIKTYAPIDEKEAKEVCRGDGMVD